ncbi:MAG: hypothetical protein RO009_02185 [Pseudorhodoplanes sp.]|jgi:hypothetical protein|nr:hypothetical protein [Pseudorhodoplanes sp.]
MPPSDAYDGCCPNCGKVYTLAELKKMAVGDGWQRYLRVIDREGVVRVVSFDEFVPTTMTPFYGRASAKNALRCVSTSES